MHPDGTFRTAGAKSPVREPNPPCSGMGFTFPFLVLAHIPVLLSVPWLCLLMLWMDGSCLCYTRASNHPSGLHYSNLVVIFQQSLELGLFLHLYLPADYLCITFMLLPWKSPEPSATLLIIR